MHEDRDRTLKADGTGGRSGQHTRRAFLRGSGAAVTAGVATLATGGLLDAGNRAKAATRTASSLTQTASSLQRVARDAVVFGIPAVLQSRYLEISEQAGFTRNRFWVNLTLSTPATHVAGPNDDTLYGLGWLDLTAGPQVIGVPATHGRYYSLQLIDMWSNPFAYIGLRATGDQAGAYAITPPGWHGTLPPGVRRIESPTKRLLVLVRTAVSDPADLAAAQEIHTSYTTGPLARYPHDRTSPGTVDQALNVIAPIDLTGSGISLYEEINSLILEYPPLPADAGYARGLRAVGVDVRRYKKPGAELADVLLSAIKPAVESVQAATSAPLSQTPSGWNVNYHVTSVTHDPLTRAALTIYGPGTHIAEEALYFNAAQAGGAQLTGANSYTVTFPKGQLPPVGAFWSVILYDATTFWLVDNPIDRYEIASHTDGLVYGADGALTIAVQNSRPNSSAVNWLPAPAGAFRLILRTYLPEPAVLDGTWTPPPVQRTA